MSDIRYGGPEGKCHQCGQYANGCNCAMNDPIVLMNVDAFLAAQRDILERSLAKAAAAGVAEERKRVLEWLRRSAADYGRSSAVAAALLVEAEAIECGGHVQESE